MVETNAMRHAQPDDQNDETPADGPLYLTDVHGVFDE